MEFAKNIVRTKPSGQIAALATSFFGTAETAFTAAPIAPAQPRLAVSLRQRFKSAWAVVMRWLELPVVFLGLVALFVIFPLDQTRGRQ